MQLFALSQLIEESRASGNLYLEFLRVSAFSMGLYALAAGSVDPQHPHTEDEVYYVLARRFQ
jgi:hypothetical protein